MMAKLNNVLVVAAHPDDEILGCGGTIAYHSSRGDTVRVLFITDGISSRDEFTGIKRRREACRRACHTVGANIPVFLDFPDNKLDTVPLLEVTKQIEQQIADCPPNIVYTHFAGDLNIDHSIVHRAVITACRPQPGFPVKEIYSFEVPSATGWLPSTAKGQFEPNVLVDISNFLEKKLDALREYDDEMRPFPHSRSYENLEHLARYRGATVGLAAAEGFIAERILINAKP